MANGRYGHNGWSPAKMAFKRLVDLAELGSFTLHDLRKICNTPIKNAIVSPETAMQILGHKTLRVNQQHYTGVLTKL